MPNSLGSVVDKFTTRLDQKVTAGTCTSDLNMNQDLLGEYSGNGKIEIATIAPVSYTHLTLPTKA